MSSLTRLVITAPQPVAGFKSVCDLAPGQFPAANNFINYLSGLTGGNYSATLAFKVGAVQASGTITQTSTGAANGETLVVAGITFTARTSGATGNEWNRNNTVATSATNLAAAINASTDLTGICTATSLLGVVTITASVPGLMGNGLVITESCSNTTCVTFASGTDGTAYTLTF